jgi:c-di-GMP-binding flagellar brake protein YcgR
MSPQEATEQRPDDFRVDADPEIEAWLRQLLSQQVTLQLSTPEGLSYGTRLWNLDPERHALNLEAQGHAGQLQALIDSPEVMAVAYLDQIRLEFELGPLVLVQGPAMDTLRAPWPQQLYRFQRRQAFRVQPLGAPRVLLQHPDHPDMALQLRVLDLSVTGLALQLPPGLPRPGAGQVLAEVRVELERDNYFNCELRVQHVSEADAGPRLGCAFGRLPQGAERALQLYIDQTQKRQRLLRKS